MRFRACLILGGLTFALFAVPIFGQPGDKKPPEPKPGVKLPITRVVLFNAGIGYFHREGAVTDTTRVDLKVNEEDVNDLILTLVATDPTGTSRAVTYDNRAPADITLKAFSIDLTENPSVGNLLHQVRGEKVEITDAEGKTLTGNIVSVDKPVPTVIHPDATTLANLPEGAARPLPVVLPPQAGAVEQVSLLTDDGLQAVTLSKVKKVKFTKADLQAEFRKALEALAAARGANTKSVGVTFAGKGERKVSVGYIADAPLWKPTYRVLVGDAGTKLVGLAAVENTTDEDWENVVVKLLSGRPMTYKMDLYDPLYIPRPVIEPELYASLRPPVYQGVAQAQLGGNTGFGGGGQFQGGIGGFGGGFAGGQLGNLGGQFGIQGGGFGGMVPGRYGHPTSTGYGGISRPSVRSLLGERLDYDTRTNRLSAPPDPDAPKPPTNYLPNPNEMKNLGESFEYAVKDPVNLPRFKSALLPIVDEKIEAKRISIYNPQVLGNYPLKGLHLKNTSKQFLAQGPVTVYEGDTAAGQARLPDVKPGESRLLSYAIDLDVGLRMTPVEDVKTPVSYSFANGVLGGRMKVRTTTRYVTFNKSTEAKTVWVTQPIKADWKLIEPAKPVETTAELYRFEVVVPPGKSATLDVIEEQEQPGLADDLLKVSAEVVPGPKTPVSFSLTNSVLSGKMKVRTITRYAALNKSTEMKSVRVTQPVKAKWTLVEPVKPVETTAELYRFEVAVPPGKSATLDVIEEQEQPGLADDLLKVSVEVLPNVRTPVSMSLDKGKLTEVSRLSQTTRYTFTNAADAERALEIFRSASAAWKLVTPQKSVAYLPTFQHFATTVPPKGTAKFDVVEESELQEVSDVAKLAVEAIDVNLKQTYVPPAVKNALGQLRAVRVAESEAVAGIAEEQAALKDINDEQTRIRANIERVPKDSEAYKRYLKKFDDQETEIEKRQAKVKELTKTRDRKAKELADLVRTLKAE